MITNDEILIHRRDNGVQGAYMINIPLFKNLRPGSGSYREIVIRLRNNLKRGRSLSNRELEDNIKLSREVNKWIRSTPTMNEACLLMVGGIICYDIVTNTIPLVASNIRYNNMEI
jgi:hypothetical protein